MPILFLFASLVHHRCIISRVDSYIAFVIYTAYYVFYVEIWCTYARTRAAILQLTFRADSAICRSLSESLLRGTTTRYVHFSRAHLVRRLGWEPRVYAARNPTLSRSCQARMHNSAARYGKAAVNTRILRNPGAIPHSRICPPPRLPPASVFTSLLARRRGDPGGESPSCSRGLVIGNLLLHREWQFCSGCPSKLHEMHVFDLLRVI